MSADPIVYCLEQLTDYRQFERLCCDLMAGSGYSEIQPLGGANDRGRDGIHIDRRDPDDVTIFAYTVRSDWRQKLLNEDCRRIQEEGHQLRRLVFACTSGLSASQKDDIKAAVQSRFGWELDIFDLERIRIQLTGDLRHLVAQHPSIFCPPWFPARGGLSIAESHDTVVIDHIAADHALATWISRRLQLVGYRAWCYGTAPLAGENADETVRILIDKRAISYLPVLSSAALGDSDLIARCGIASGRDELTVPCWSEDLDPSTLSSRFRSLTPVRFGQGWSAGLRDLMTGLDTRNVPKAMDEDQGKEVALRSYVPEPVTRPSPERLYANVFSVTVPAGVIICELEQALPENALSELRREWGFVQASPTKLLAFHEPPAGVPIDRKQHLPEYAWACFVEREGKRSVDVVKELVRRCLDVACYRAGLLWCDDRKMLYFPHLDKPQRNVSYRHVDGRRTWVSVTGEKTYGKGEQAEPFRYQLSPIFRVGRDENGAWWVTTRLYVRVTTCRGVPYEKKAIIKRRKVVTRSWWNKEWFARTIAVMQAISEGRDEIEVGVGHRRLGVATIPLQWDCPVSIDLAALERVGDFQEEMAAMRFYDEQDDEDSVAEVDGDEAAADEQAGGADE